MWRGAATASAVAALMVAMPGAARALDVSALINQIAVQITSFFQSESDSNAAAIAQGQLTGPVNHNVPQVATHNPAAGPVTAPPVANAAPIVTAGDAVTSKASVIARGTINQSIEQRTSAEQKQKAKNAGAIAQGQIAGQPFNNDATQDATSAPAVAATTSGAVANAGEIEAGGDAVVSEASVDAGTIDQSGDQAKQQRRARAEGEERRRHRPGPNCRSAVQQ